MTPARLRIAIAAALVLVAAACGDTTSDDTTSDESPSNESEPQSVTLVAENIAFDSTSLDATVGQPLAITYDNRDGDVPHNLVVEGAAGGTAKTEIEQGPLTQNLEVTFDEAGDFEYFCEVHPQQMRGTVTVSE